MKLLIVRHADPDYSIDSLTPKGWKEAKLLSNRLSKLAVKEYYVSPLGRAKDTASLTLEKVSRKAVECEWLREFDGHIIRPDTGTEKITWDWLPADWTVQEEYYQRDLWHQTEVMKAGQIQKEYDWVIKGFDALLEKGKELLSCFAGKYRYDYTILSFWGGVCTSFPFAQHFANDTLAWFLCGAFFCYNDLYGGAKEGDCLFPH